MVSSVQANAVNCVKGEIHNVLTVLRLNARWGTRARFTKEIPLQAESPLIRSLKSLHTYLEAVHDLGRVDAVKYLDPFLAVVESPHTTGPMTGAALSSLHKFLLYGFMSPESPRAREGIDRIARSITNFHFEETDPDSDEVVLMKLLELSALCLRCEVGRLLSDSRCWDIFQSCYRISHQEHASSLLGNTAGNTLAHIVLIIFSRPRIPPLSPNVLGETFKHRPSAKNSIASNFEGSDDSDLVDERVVQGGGNSDEEDEKLLQLEDSGSDHSTLRSFLVRSREVEVVDVLVEVMRFLSRLSNPRENSDETCILCLSLINIALEAGGCHLGQHTNLVEVMQGDLCKHLLNSSQTEDMTILSLTLRVVFNLFNSIKDHIKVQLEVFITSIHLRILEGGQSGLPGHPPEQRELVLESLLEFCREPTLMLDLYINYDCDVQCTNLFETVCNALSRAAVPSIRVSQLNVLNRLALECVLSVIESMAKRCVTPSKTRSAVGTTRSLQGSPEPPNSANLVFLSNSSCVSFDDTGDTARGLGSAYSELEFDSEVDGGAMQAANWTEQARLHSVAGEVLAQRKRTKRKLALAAQKFNSDQKGWVLYAQELGLIPSPAAPQAVARFLKVTLGLDKSQLGEYLSKGPIEKYPFNAEVLRDYTALFDFKTVAFDEALRAYLKEFRLPGEAQCIDRLMEAFAREYYVQGRGHHPFADADAAFILAFSVIMLNTDLHSPQIRDDKRMSKIDFIRNNRQINAGADLPSSFLEALYDSILANEIAVRHDLHDGSSGLIDYDIHWDGILHKSRNVTLASFTPAAEKRISFGAGVHERDMFASIAEGALQALSTVFDRSQDDALILKALHGLHCYGKVCIYFNMIDPFNALLVSLFRYGMLYMTEISTGLHPPPYPPLISTEGLPDVNDLETIATLAANTHRHRGLLALKSALELVRIQGNSTSFAWQNFCEAMLKLFDLHALPQSIMNLESFNDSSGQQFPPTKFARQSWQGGDRKQSVKMGQGSQNQSTGLLGGLNSFFWGSKGEVEDSEGSESSVEEQDSLSALSQVVATCHVEQLFSSSKDLSVENVKYLLHALLNCRDPTSVTINGDGKLASNFETHAVFALELASKVLFANRQRIESLWPLMHSYLSNVLGSNLTISRFPFLAERMTILVLRSCVHMLGQSKHGAKILIDSLSLLAQLPVEVLHPLSSRIATGLLKMVQNHATQLDGRENWSLLAILLGSSAATAEGRPMAWEVVAYMAERGPLSANNMRPIFQLVIWFMKGEFVNQGANCDLTYTPQALNTLATFVLTLTGVNQNTEDSVEFICEKPVDQNSPHAPILTQLQADSLWETSLRLSTPLVANENALVSKSAASCVHRLLHQSAVKSHVAWHAVFMDVLLKLPIGHKASSNEPNASEDRFSEELCLRCCTLVSRALLQNLPLLAMLPGFNTIWLTLVALLGSNITNNTPGTVAHETCQQIITNMIMVVAHAGVFQQWSLEGGKSRDLLADTWKLVDPVCPSIRPLFGQRTADL